MRNPEIVRELFQRSAQAMQRSAASDTLMAQIQTASDAILKCYRADGALFTAGNGGSAADAQHIAAELVGKLCRDRSPIRAFAMTVDTSLLTAIGNDYGYEHSFSRQVEGIMRKGDLFFAISTSGNSQNIIRALEMCRVKGIQSILLTGPSGGKAKPLADCPILVPGDETGHIQESHMAIYHLLCGLIEADLVAEGICSYRG